MGGAERLEVRRYSVAHVPQRDRHEAWLTRDWPSLAPLYETVPSEPFNVGSERLILGTIVLQYASITGQHWMRERSRLRSYDPDFLTAVVTVEGNAHGLFGERPLQAGAGTVQLADLSQPSSHVSTASRTILLGIPRPAAAARGLDVSELHGLVLDSAVARMLGTHLLGIRDAVSELPAASGSMLARSILDLLSLAVAGSGRPVEATAIGTDGAAAAARMLIERELGSQSLGITRLCKLLHISRSTLQRLFAAQGGVQAYIRLRRLEAARRALADPNCREPMHMLAERYGFSDSAHLSRLFRSHYGMTPTECRMLAREQAGAVSPQTGRAAQG